MREGLLNFTLEISSTGANPWVTRPALQFLTFTLSNDNSPEAEGFQFTVNASAITCRKISDFSLTCTFPPSPQYTLLAKETIDLSIVSDVAFAKTCRLLQSGLGSVTIVADTSSALAAAVAIVGASATGGAAMVGFLSGASAVDVQLVVVLFQSVCASALDRESTSLLLYFLSPFAGLGHSYMTLGNVAVVGLVWVLQFGMQTHFQRSRRIGQLDAYAAVRFPSFVFSVMSLLLIGVLYGALNALFSPRNEGSPAVAYVSAAIGLLASGVMLASTIYAIRGLAAKYVQYTQFLSFKFLKKSFYPTGFWDPETKRNAYGRLIGPFDGTHNPWCMHSLLVSFAVCLIMVPPFIPCVVRYIVCCVVTAIAAFMILMVRPYRSTVSSLFSGMSYSLLAILCVAITLGLVQPSTMIEKVKMIILLLQVLLVLCRVVYDLCVMFLENRYWVHFRNPALEDLEADELRDVNARPLLSTQEVEDATDSEECVVSHLESKPSPFPGFAMAQSPWDRTLGQKLLDPFAPPARAKNIINPDKTNSSTNLHTLDDLFGTTGPAVTKNGGGLNPFASLPRTVSTNKPPLAASPTADKNPFGPSAINANKSNAPTMIDKNPFGPLLSGGIISKNPFSVPNNAATSNDPLGEDDANNFFFGFTSSQPAPSKLPPSANVVPPSLSPKQDTSMKLQPLSTNDDLDDLNDLL